MNKKKIIKVILAASTITGVVTLRSISVEATEVKLEESPNVNLIKSVIKGQVINAPTSLRVRQGAGTNYAVIGYLVDGSTINIKGEKDNWYRIDFNGSEGYVSKDYVKLLEGNSSSNNTYSKGQVVNTSVGLNIRQSASTSSAVLGTLMDGEIFDIISESGNWYNIKWGNIVGFVYKDYVKLVNASGNNNSSSTDSSGNAITSKGKVINVPTNLRVRTEPNTSSNILGYLIEGNEVSIIGTAGDWYKIDFNGKVGYVYGEYIQVTTNVGESNSSNSNSQSIFGKGKVVNTSVGLNIRQSTSTSSSILGTLRDGQVVDLLALEGEWYKIKYNNIEGYVYKSYIQQISDNVSNDSNGDSLVNKQGQVISMSSNLRVRAEANTTSAVLGYLISGDRITILGVVGDWYKINFNNRTGYVHSDYITILGNNSSSSTEEKYEIILNAMKSQVGSPYIWGGSGEYLTSSFLRELKSWYPNETSAGMYTRAEAYVDKGYRAFDCSGLMQWGFKQAGISIGRSTWDQIGDGKEVALSNVKPGDLLFYSNLQHVGMYIGNGQWIESPNKNANVRIVNVPWNLIGRARRILD